LERRAERVAAAIATRDTRETPRHDRGGLPAYIANRDAAGLKSPTLRKARKYPHARGLGDQF